MQSRNNQLSVPEDTSTCPDMGQMELVGNQAGVGQQLQGCSALAYAPTPSARRPQTRC